MIAGGLAAATGLAITPVALASGNGGQQVGASNSHTTTPIKHVVVIYDENISFDHYFGTYPNATNTDGTPFTAKKGTPTVNGLTASLLTANPNLYNPQRLSPSQALTCDQNHGYTAEQKAFDGGKMDQFVQNTSTDTCTGQPILYGAPGLGMDYYDGNTVTALWNYAQTYAMSDNSYSDMFGPSTPGALNLISGYTANAISVDSVTGQQTPTPASFIGNPNSSGVGSIYGDPDPAYDNCSDTNHTSTTPLASLSGKNIGDLLNQQHVTWGWFQGGFTPTSTSASGLAVCGSTHTNIGGNSVADYSPHHNPFAYYKSTSNPQHLPPSSEAAIGYTDQANHNYDLSNFYTSVQAGNMPSVSFLKAAAYQDGHAGYSDPLDEQTFLVNTINTIEKSKYWKDTAIVIAYDDSDGWYDHQASTIVNGSNTSLDSAVCTGTAAIGGTQDRCGNGPRQPLLVISPYAKGNYVDHTQTTQSSVLKLVEDNWSLGRIGGGSFDATTGSLAGMFHFTWRNDAKQLILNPTTGAVVSKG
jgi:phospholipase C